MLKRGGIMKETKKENKMQAPDNINTALSSALARNIPAMRIFAEMPDEKRRGIIEGARNLSSKKELRRYVKNIKEEK